MNPYKTMTGKYQVRWREKRGGKVVRYKRTFSTRKEAVAFIENLAAERRRDKDAARRTFNDYADRYLDSAGQRCKPRTVGGYANALKHARAFLGDREVGTLRKSDADAYLAHLGSLDSMRRARSIRWAWQAFGATLDMAVGDEALASNPASKVRLPSANGRGEAKFQARFLSSEEVARLSAPLDASRPPYGLMVRFLCYTGLRASELAGLEIRYVTTWRTATGWRGEVRVEQTKRLVKGEWLSSTPKTDRSTRTVPLVPWLAEQMATFLAEHPRATDATAPLWPTRKHGGFHRKGERSAPDAESAAHGEVIYGDPLDPSAFYKSIFTPACVASGVGKVRLHDTRHTCASLWLASGIPVERVSAWLGHASIVITYNTYTHLLRGEDDHAAVSDVAEPMTAANVTPIKRTG